MSYNKFDWQYYINRYDDLKLLGVNDKKSAIEHYKKYGKTENRFPNRIMEAKNHKLNNIDKSNSFFENINNQLDTYDDSTSSLNSIQDIDTNTNNYNNKIYNEILYLKNDINSIKKELNKISNLLSKKYTIVNKKKKEKDDLLNKSFDNITQDNKIISSEEYEVCDNLSDASDIEINTINYSNELESINNISINLENNSNDINIDEISYEK